MISVPTNSQDFSKKTWHCVSLCQRNRTECVLILTYNAYSRIVCANKLAQGQMVVLTQTYKASKGTIIAIWVSNSEVLVKDTTQKFTKPFMAQWEFHTETLLKLSLGPSCIMFSSKPIEFFLMCFAYSVPYWERLENEIWLNGMTKESQNHKAQGPLAKQD